MTAKVLIVKALEHLDSYDSAGRKVSWYGRGEVFRFDVDAGLPPQGESEVHSLYSAIEQGLIEVLYVEEYG